MNIKKFSKGRRYIWVSLLCLILVSLIVSPILAFHYWTWDDVSPLYYTEDFTNSYLYTAFTSAISDWNGTDTDVWLVSYSSDPDTEGHEYELSDGNNGYTGWTIDGGELVYAEMYLNWEYLDNDTPNQRRNTANHEWGHALGLWDLTSGTSIMNVNINRSTYYVPQQFDIDEINGMY